MRNRAERWAKSQALVATYYSDVPTGDALLDEAVAVALDGLQSTWLVVMERGE